MRANVKPKAPMHPDVATTRALNATADPIDLRTLSSANFKSCCIISFANVNAAVADASVVEDVAVAMAAGDVACTRTGTTRIF